MPTTAPRPSHRRHTQYGAIFHFTLIALMRHRVQDGGLSSIDLLAAHKTSAAVDSVTSCDEAREAIQTGAIALLLYAYEQAELIDTTDPSRSLWNDLRARARRGTSPDRFQLACNAAEALIQQDWARFASIDLYDESVCRDAAEAYIEAATLLVNFDGISWNPEALGEAILLYVAASRLSESRPIVDRPQDLLVSEVAYRSMETYAKQQVYRIAVQHKHDLKSDEERECGAQAFQDKFFRVAWSIPLEAWFAPKRAFLYCQSSASRAAWNAIREISQLKRPLRYEDDRDREGEHVYVLFDRQTFDEWRSETRQESAPEDSTKTAVLASLKTISGHDLAIRLANGESLRTIAAESGISHVTVKRHVDQYHKRAYEKLKGLIHTKRPS